MTRSAINEITGYPSGASSPQAGKERLHMMAAVVFGLALVLCSQPGEAAQRHHAEVLVGNVTVKHVPDRGLAILVRPLDTAGAPTERVIFLQTEEPIPTELPIRMRRAEVIYKKDRVLAVSLDGHTGVGFFLSDPESTAAEQPAQEMLQQSGAETILVLGGYGLSSHRGRFPSTIESWPPEVDGPALLGKSVVLSESSTCHSGGAGASSCSVDCPEGGTITFGGCSVTCKDGYYACCSCDNGVPECKCYEDGSGGSDCPPTCEPKDET